MAIMLRFVFPTFNPNLDYIYTLEGKENNFTIRIKDFEILESLGGRVQYFDFMVDYHLAKKENFIKEIKQTLHDNDYYFFGLDYNKYSPIDTVIYVSEIKNPY